MAWEWSYLDQTERHASLANAMANASQSKDTPGCLVHSTPHDSHLPVDLRFDLDLGLDFMVCLILIAMGHYHTDEVGIVPALCLRDHLVDLLLGPIFFSGLLSECR